MNEHNFSETIKDIMDSYNNVTWIGDSTAPQAGPNSPANMGQLYGNSQSIWITDHTSTSDPNKYIPYSHGEVTVGSNETFRADTVQWLERFSHLNEGKFTIDMAMSMDERFMDPDKAQGEVFAFAGIDQSYTITTNGTYTAF